MLSFRYPVQCVAGIRAVCRERLQARAALPLSSADGRCGPPEKSTLHDRFRSFRRSGPLRALRGKTAGTRPATVDARFQGDPAFPRPWTVALDRKTDG